MITLNLDFETFNAYNDLKAVGTYRYAEDAEVLMLGWAIDPEADPEIWIPEQDPMPYEIKETLYDPQVVKRAFNATFERRIFIECLDIEVPIEQWRCTAVEARAMGLPGNLDGATKAMGFPEDKAKDKRGKALIKLFCQPHKPTKKHPWTRATPATHPVEWAELMEYCKQDVRAERALYNALQTMTPLSAAEWRLYELDQRINDRGVAVNEELIDAAIYVDETEKNRLMERAGALTGLENPNSRDQLLDWLQKETGDEFGLIVTNVTKDTVEQLLDGREEGTVKEVLEIRQQLSKSSVSKYAAAKRMLCRKTRKMHGTTQFYGAGRTGRWAGRGFQLHNLVKPPRWSEEWGNEEYEAAVAVVTQRDPDLLRMLYGSAAEMLSMLVRPVIVGSNGKPLGVVDFSAIEGRVNAWLANEEWALEVYRTHGMIYEATAAGMYKVPIESIQYKDADGKKQRGPNYFMRQKGKVSTLLLGYQGSEGALIVGGALKDGLLVEELLPIVHAWRRANPNIVNNWYETERAAKMALMQPGKAFRCGHVVFRKTDRWLEIKLPSGRKLRYIDAALEDSGIVYWGEDSVTKQWKKLDTYGGKLVENICQAIARDLLAEAMLRLDEAGYYIVLHVHDEAVAELDLARGESITEMEEIMGQPVDWAPGLPLAAAGYVTNLYRKD